MRTPRNMDGPLVVRAEQVRKDLFSRFGNALSPQLYQSETSPSRHVLTVKRAPTGGYPKNYFNAPSFSARGSFCAGVAQFLGDRQRSCFGYDVFCERANFHAANTAVRPPNSAGNAF